MKQGLQVRIWPKESDAFSRGCLFRLKEMAFSKEVPDIILLENKYHSFKKLQKYSFKS